MRRIIIFVLTTVTTLAVTAAPALATIKNMGGGPPPAHSGSTGGILRSLTRAGSGLPSQPAGQTPIAMSDERHPTATPVHNPATMVLILSAWTAPDGSLEIRISKNVDGGSRRDTMWVDTAEAAGDAVRRAVEELTTPPD